jgi:Cell Wall Hydrolase
MATFTASPIVSPDPGPGGSFMEQQAGWIANRKNDLANMLATNTLGSNTKIAANTAESGTLANQLASQMNPLDVIGKQMQLGVYPSPTTNSLMELYGGRPSASSSGSGGTFQPGTPFVAKNLPSDISPDEDAMVRTVAGESSGQPLAGQIGVASVIANRAKGAGVSPRDVVFAPNQFEPWNGGDARARMEAMDPGSSEYQQILNNVVRPVMSGKAKDPTGGATHFYAPAAQSALGRQPPTWGQGQPSAVIGGHNFYNVGYGPAPADTRGVAARTGGTDVAGPPGSTIPPSAVNPTPQAAAPLQTAAGGAGPVAATPGFAALPPLTLTGQSAPLPPGVQAAGPGASTPAPIPQPPPTALPAPSAPDHEHAIAVSGALSQQILNAPPDQRPALWAQLRPQMIQAGAVQAPVDYPGDSVLGYMRDSAANPEQRAQHIAALNGGPQPGAAAAPVQVAGPGTPTPPAAPPPIANPNALLGTATPGAMAAAPTNQLMPAASAAPPPQAAPATGLNSPQVQQAQELLRRAAQIKIVAAQTPLDLRAKATAEAMAADLTQRAAVLMQADSTIIDPKTGIGRSTLTGAEKSAAIPRLDYTKDQATGAYLAPGAKPVFPPNPRLIQVPGQGVFAPDLAGGPAKQVVQPDLPAISAQHTAEAGGTAAATSAAKVRDALPTLARESTTAIGNIDYGLRQLDDAAKGGIPTGYFAPALATAAAAAKSLGIDVPGIEPGAVGSIQAASKTLAVVSGAILKNILGSAEITEGKIQAFIHAQPGIVNDPQATHKILNWARSQFVYDHEMAMDGLAKVDKNSGMLSPGWQADYITQHGAAPIFDRISGEMKQPDGQAPPRESPKEAAAAPLPAYTLDNPFRGTRAEIERLPSGTPFFNPATRTVITRH